MMLLRTAIVTVGMMLVLGLSASAGEPPVNFSGTWEMDRSRSVLPSRASAVPGNMTLVIQHSGDTLHVERHVKLMGLNRTSTSTFYTDGRESSNTARGETIVSRGHWDGPTLVMEHRSTVTRSGRQETVESTDTRRLIEDGKVMVVDSTTRRPGAEPERNTLVFVRK